MLTEANLKASIWNHLCKGDNTKPITATPCYLDLFIMVLFHPCETVGWFVILNMFPVNLLDTNKMLLSSTELHMEF